MWSKQKLVCVETNVASKGFELENGQGATIGKKLFETIQNRQSLETLRLLGMDGTAANSK